jgi:hypothetical protein
MSRVGFDLLLGRTFNEIGFGQIQDEIFKQLVICRISYPNSKLKTTEYLYRYKQISWSEDQAYRYLDKLYNPTDQVGLPSASTPDKSTYICISFVDYKIYKEPER